ncbi:LuxR C-terminal-related transcriptional regulator [Actinomycetospora lutea]|uniref:helix-turn-helix transcriptional regulator n=1 Tax=Actinomycetospora lutea TaxID=663604 RepID=UPI002367254E|nr:LuxR family transcriptional regulator [Actinomycetospora lutea]MDD7941960.1 LuxR C-terminal-related transcriptional regulator [Actinomycetospora lutea]
MSDRPPSVPLPVVGRARERAELAAATDPDRPDGTVTVLRGEPGSGKTTLLDEVAGATSRAVLRTAGVDGDAVLPFAALADLLLPILRHTDGLPAVQREALEIALALRGGDVGSPLAVSAAALGVLAGAADVRPLLLVVDDFAWIDPPSQQVLLFVARRLAPERIALLLGVRDEMPVDPAIWRLPTIALGPLSADESRELVRTLPVRTSPAVLETIVERCGGNPLAVVETARTAGPDLLAAAATLPPGSALERAWSAAIDGLPAATRSAMAVLALSRSPRRDDVEPVLADLGLGAEDLLPAERRRLVHRDDEEMCLRHDLLRPLLATRTSRELRRQVLRGLARHAPRDVAVWYLAESTEAPDDDVAERLVEAATSARRRSALQAAARAWARAADFTADPVTRADRLLTAATDAAVAGSSTLAASWCEQALGLRHDPEFAADVELVRTRALSWLDPARAVDGAIRAADAVLPHDRARAARLFVEAAVPLTMTGRLREMEAVADRARTAGDDTPMGLATVGHAYALVGRWTDAGPLLDRLVAGAADTDPVWDAQALTVGAQAACFLERFDEAGRLFGAVTATARQVGAPLVLAFALTAHAEIDWWAGRWSAAYADVTEAVEWADELGQAGSRAFGATLLARLDGARGDVASCRAHADAALQGAGPLGIASIGVYAAAALGAGALAAGEPATAAAHLARARRLSDEMGTACATSVPFAGDLVDAMVRSGDRAGAEAAVAWVARDAGRTGAAYSTAIAARGRGLLADDPDDAEVWFATAREAHDRLDAPFEQARTVLAHAEARRRWRRPGAARPLLLDAEATFSGLGARPWVERVRLELAATGHRASGEAPEETTSLGALTPQEFQIARGIADGLSNVEVAAALFVSRKTVEAHLTRIYRKLGVRSRTELATEFTRRRRLPEGTP